ncbi:MAG: ribose 5-phosphate isomerase B [Erysipelotrichaceae bacterium]
MRIAIANDHSSIELKNDIKLYLESLGHGVVNFGTNTKESVDYPDYAALVAKAVLADEVDRGILICGTGLGMAIAANKIKNIRAGVCSDTFTAKMAKAHNDCHIICFGSRVVGIELAKEIVDSFINAKFEGGRHCTRVDKIMALE